MDGISDFIKRVAIDKEDPENVRLDVIRFKKRFNKVHFCFEPGEAYDYINKMI